MRVPFSFRRAQGSIAFSRLVYRKRGRDASALFYVAPTGLDCSLLLLPRAMPWATIFRPFGAERNPLYSNPENGLAPQGRLKVRAMPPASTLYSNPKNT